MKKQALNLAKVGILLFLGAIIPYIGSIFPIAAGIILLIAYSKFSKYYRDNAIFNQCLAGFITSYAGSIISFGLIIGGLVGTFMGMEEIRSEPEKIVEKVVENPGLLFSSSLVVIGLVLGFLVSVVSNYFYFNANKQLSIATGEKLFNTAGLLYFIGAVLNIILIGVAVTLIGYVVHIVAIFSLEPEEIPQENVNVDNYFNSQQES